MPTQLKSKFLLRDDIAYLNFGSFGACPSPVFEAYQAFQRELEEEPSQFFSVKGPAYLKRSREALGAYLNCAAQDLVYVPNPSHAVNIVAKSFKLNPGDEILTTDIEYGACEKTWSYYCKKAGAVLRRQHIALPLVSSDSVVAALFAGVSKKTRLIFVSHITSSTALILPVGAIAKKAKELGIPCFIDGAHAPAHIGVDLGALDVEYYTGACHKWMMAPKGCAFLYTRQDRQAVLDPLVVSWGYESANPSSSQYLDYHEGQGTRDYSAFISVPACIDFMKEFDWPSVSKECRKMVLDNAPRFTSLFACEALAPLTDEFIGQMLSLPIKTSNPDALQLALFREHQVEIPVMRHGASVYLRYSINAFNSQSDLDKLYDALRHIMNKTSLLGS
jgi:isopenicillin-N epimerase